MRNIFAIMLVGSLSFNVLAQSPNKMAHSHKAAMGGSVLMSGDDHFEFLQGKVPGTIEIHASDKFREPVAAKNISGLKVQLVNGSEKTELPVQFDDKIVCQITVKLPTKVPAGAKLEISGKRKDAPKGYIAGTSPQLIDVAKIPKAKVTDDPHAGHHM